MNVTAKELLARLQRHYIKPGELMAGGIFMPEVTLGVRRADALYIGFFQSRGRHLVGHEIKVSRADWLHELDQPAKAEAWEPNCHAWYVVAPSTSIVRPEELPEGWGLMVTGRSKTRMEIVVKAAVHPDRVPSWEATHALVQRADSLRMDAITKDRAATSERLYRDIEQRVAAGIAAHTGDDRLERERDRLFDQLTQLEQILGLTIADNRWQDGAVTVDEIRASFARWVAADKDVQRAIGTRFWDVQHAQDRLAEALTAIEKVRDNA
jgi:hypothetical protein